MTRIQRGTSKSIVEAALQQLKIVYFKVGREFAGSNRFAVLVFLSLAVVFGCSSGAKGTHTHLWVGDNSQNFWTYERVESIEQSGETVEIAGFLVQELKSGDKVTLMNGSTITYDGTILIVNDHKVSTENVQLESNGTVRVNAFIKTK